MAITNQEAWTRRNSAIQVEVPDYLRQLVEEIAFQARDDKRVDKRSGVSQRLPITVLESIVSSAEQRATRTREKCVVARIADLYAALPAITGKLELEYEGELKGAETIARELIRTAIGRVFTKHFSEVNSSRSSNGSNSAVNSKSLISLAPMTATANFPTSRTCSLT